jgi:hypothetical protein
VASSGATTLGNEGHYPVRMEIKIAYAFIGLTLTGQGGIILEMK